ncbi:MAG: hypothetical protein AAGA67_10810, partial [Cyanobacteria bacterium P01_F01_bin.153]
QKNCIGSFVDILALIFERKNKERSADDCNGKVGKILQPQRDDGLYDARHNRKIMHQFNDGNSIVVVVGVQLPKEK